MSDYKTLYYELFRRMADVIDQMVAIQQRIEDAYIDQPEPDLILLEKQEGPPIQPD